MLDHCRLPKSSPAPNTPAKLSAVKYTLPPRTAANCTLPSPVAMETMVFGWFRSSVPARRASCAPLPAGRSKHPAEPRHACQPLAHPTWQHPPSRAGCRRMSTCAQSQRCATRRRSRRRQTAGCRCCWRRPPPSSWMQHGEAGSHWVWAVRGGRAKSSGASLAKQTAGAGASPVDPPQPCLRCGRTSCRMGWTARRWRWTTGRGRCRRTARRSGLSARPGGTVPPPGPRYPTARRACGCPGAPHSPPGCRLAGALV